MKRYLLAPYNATRYLFKGLMHNADGTFSSTKFWQSIGMGVATYVVVLYAQAGTLGTEMFLSYMALVTGARSFQNYLATKKPPGNEPPAS